MESALGKVLVTGANGFTGAWLCQHLARKGVPTRGMYYGPDGAPSFSHPNLELVPGDLRDRESLKRALDGVAIVQNVAASTGRPTCRRRRIGTSMWTASATSSRNPPGLA